MKAECKDEGKTEFFPEGFAEGILSYEKIGKAERKDEGKTEFFPEEFAKAHPVFSKRQIKAGWDEEKMPPRGRLPDGCLLYP